MPHHYKCTRKGAETNSELKWMNDDTACQSPLRDKGYRYHTISTAWTWTTTPECFSNPKHTLLPTSNQFAVQNKKKTQRKTNTTHIVRDCQNRGAFRHSTHRRKTIAHVLEASMCKDLQNITHYIISLPCMYIYNMLCCAHDVSKK